MIENAAFEQAAVTIYDGGRQIRTVRVGGLTGQERVTVRAPQREVWFEVKYLAGQKWTSDEIFASPGDEIVLRLRQQPAFNTLFRR